jgi:hypothetical protein
MGSAKKQQSHCRVFDLGSFDKVSKSSALAGNGLGIRFFAKKSVLV